MAVCKKPKILTQEDFTGLWENEKVSGENIRLQVTESLSNLTRNKLNSTLKSKELNSQSQLPLKITWLWIGLGTQES